MLAGVGAPFQDRRACSYLTGGHELSEQTHVLTEQETLLGRGTQAEQEGKGPRGLLCHVAPCLGIHGGGVSFRVVSGSSF